jgi:phage shock protein C
MDRRLHRSRRDRILFGVAGGLAEYLGLDPTLVRVVWAVLIFAWGAGLLLYIVLAIVIPEEDELPAGDAPTASEALRPARGLDSRNGSLIIGGLLVVIGAVFLVRELLPSIDFDWFWPLALVGLGVLILVSALRPGGTTRPGGQS